MKITIFTAGFLSASEIRKKVFFTDENNFFLNPPVKHQNDRVWSAGNKKDVDPSRLVVERAKFVSHVMLSAGVCYGE